MNRRDMIKRLTAAALASSLDLEFSAADTPHLHIGVIIYPRMDQMDFTGPFEVFCRIPNSTVHVLWKDKNPLKDARGLVLTPQEVLSEAPLLDVLHVPGGSGQEALMDDEVILPLIKKQMESGRYVFSVCTGALICGAAGILRGRKATTHWTTFDLLKYFGAIPVDSRVVTDENLITTAGVSAGIDGALRLASLLRGEEVAQQIQLYMEYAPEPPFHSGTPKSAGPEIMRAIQTEGQEIKKARTVTAQRIAHRLGVMCQPLSTARQANRDKPGDRNYLRLTCSFSLGVFRQRSASSGEWQA